MKTCPACERQLPVSQFNIKQRDKGRLQVYCRECSRAYVREHYARNTAYYIAKARKRNKRIRTDSLERVVDYLREHPCVDCGESDVVVLQFDHIDRATKRFEISVLVNNNSSWSTIQLEIAKCEVRCANCHLRRTAKQFNWYRLGTPGRG